MDKPVTKAVMETGLVDENTIEQLRRWGLLTTTAEVQNYENPGAIVDRIREALEGDELVEFRSTDLDIIRHYLATRQKGRLYIPTPEDETRTVSLPVEYSITEMGEAVIPWTSENIQDLLLHDKTYLKLSDGTKVKFAHVQELYYDNKKAFVVCAPAES